MRLPDNLNQGLSNLKFEAKCVYVLEQVKSYMTRMYLKRIDKLNLYASLIESIKNIS